MGRPTSSVEADLRRRVPSVDQLMREDAVRLAILAHGRTSVLRALRGLLDEARARAAEGDEGGLMRLVDTLAPRLLDALARAAAPSLIPVINATGVVVHTNLGRAPLSAAAAARVAEVARSYSNLELDLATGERGDREAHAEARLRGLLEAEATAVVNNGAAAVLLAVNTLAEGREVIVSRGELVEIGGSFRIPDVLGKGGARLREVGTTNRTRLSDYRAACGPETGMILKVHPSNFRIVGFTEAVSVSDLAPLAREAAVALVEDLGSGLLVAPESESLAEEPAAIASLRAGADIVAFSGDKLLGGPQAGLLAGRRGLIDAMRKNPLYRALRVDKMTLAALDAVLVEHEAERAGASVPVLRMIGASLAELRARAAAFAEGLETSGAGFAVALAEGTSAVGGGAAPTASLPTMLVAVSHGARSASQLAARLRAHRPPVIVRVADARVVLDLRTVPPEQEAVLREALVAVVASTE